MALPGIDRHRLENALIRPPHGDEVAPVLLRRKVLYARHPLVQERKAFEEQVAAVDTLGHVGWVDEGREGVNMFCQPSPVVGGLSGGLVG